MNNIKQHFEEAHSVLSQFLSDDTNFKNIETILFSNISLLQKQRFTNLIQKNYEFFYFM